MRAVNVRAKQIPKEYETKAETTDRKYGAAGHRTVKEALNDMPQVRGIAVGAFGELSDEMNLLIKGFAHEGALNNGSLYAGRNKQEATSAISWWLKRRWSRLAVITAAEVRYDATRYVGGSAQQRATQSHFEHQRGQEFQYEFERR